MDSEFGDFGWLTNMQHKFEALLPDVDDVLSDERLKYVEDQFQTVGSNIQTQLYAISANFTQFCTELAHDVLSPTSSILNDGEKKAGHEKSDVILGKGNSAHQSSFFHKNEKIFCPDKKELKNMPTENKVTDDLVPTKIQNVYHTAGKDLSAFSDTVEVIGSRKCKDCQDEEEATVSVYGAAGELLIQDDLLKSRSDLLSLNDDSYMDSIRPAKEVTVWDNYFTSNCAECSINLDGEAAGNCIIVNYDDDSNISSNISSELNLGESCVLLEKDESVFVCRRTAKHRPFKEESGGGKRNDATIFTITKNRDKNLSMDSDWEII